MTTKASLLAPLTPKFANPLRLSPRPQKPPSLPRKQGDPPGQARQRQVEPRQHYRGPQGAGSASNDIFISEQPLMNLKLRYDLRRPILCDQSNLLRFPILPLKK